MIINTLVDFIKNTDAMDAFGEITIYRGQDVQRNLIPSISRNDPKLNTTDVERKIIKQLKLQASSYLPHGETELDLLVRAQHFGLKTRLLDWTTNPLVALWFACNNPSATNAYVYSLVADELMIDNPYDEDPFLLERTRVFQPRMNNSRIIAQSGWFTLHRYSNKNKKFVSLESMRHVKKHLTEFKIPAACKIDVLRSLELHGVNQKTIYPDIHGVCSYLNWKNNL